MIILERQYGGFEPMMRQLETPCPILDGVPR